MNVVGNQTFWGELGWFAEQVAKPRKEEGEFYGLGKVVGDEGRG